MYLRSCTSTFSTLFPLEASLRFEPYLYFSEDSFCQDNSPCIIFLIMVIKHGMETMAIAREARRSFVLVLLSSLKAEQCEYAWDRMNESNRTDGRARENFGSLRKSFDTKQLKRIHHSKDTSPTAGAAGTGDWRAPHWQNVVSLPLIAQSA